MAAVEVKAEDISAMFAVKKKKKKSKKKKSEEVAGADGTPSDDGASKVAVEEAMYPYADLLQRVYTIMESKNPGLTQTQSKMRLKPPQVMRVGTTRTCWLNFSETCVTMERKPQHVLSFFLAELGCTGSIDGTNRLLMKGRFVPKKIESLLRKYINEYVTCRMCRSTRTMLSRNAMTRLYFVECTSCGASRSVATIKAGFHAVGRGERRKARR
jgi:translation initiation factor 2 subunit 2